MNGFQETVVIWSAECLRLLRTARVVALLGLYSLFSGVVILGVALLRPLMESFAQAGLLADKGTTPLAVQGVFYLSLFFLPVYAALMGFDQVSGEVGPRSIRYLTVRARRTSVLLGKFLAQATLLLGLVLGSTCASASTRASPRRGSAWPRSRCSLFKFWMASTVFTLAYLALTTLCSSLFRTPPVSLVSNLVVLMLRCSCG